MALIDTLKELVTWWTGQTLGTRLYTRRNGVKVGEDEEGNRFYRSKDGKRRWVIYNGPVEASRISADWHGWLHHTYDKPPTEAPFTVKPWEKAHQPNLTGSGLAYRPPGSMLATARRPEATGDYEAWRPE